MDILYHLELKDVGEIQLVIVESQVLDGKEG